MEAHAQPDQEARGEGRDAMSHTERQRHRLSFRGTDYDIPASYGRCRDCGALVQIEAWLAETCPGRPEASTPEHVQ